MGRWAFRWLGRPWYWIWPRVRLGRSWLGLARRGLAWGLRRVGWLWLGVAPWARARCGRRHSLSLLWWLLPRLLWWLLRRLQLRLVSPKKAWRLALCRRAACLH